MSVRAIQARVECDPQTLEHMWRTHRLFNERLPPVLSCLFKMRRGEHGKTPEIRAALRAFARCLLRCKSQNVYDPLIKAAQSSRSDATARGLLERAAENDEEKRACAAAFKMFGRGELPLAEVKEALDAELPNQIVRKLFEESAQCIRGHLELSDIWQKEHADWLKNKGEWEADEEHQKYLALRPRFEAFEKQAGGPAGKRRARWHLYLEWLKENPDLAAWQGGTGVVNELSAEARRRVQKAKPSKQRSVEADEFWKANPDLSVLDRLHGYYEREFIRRRKTKKNPDGFKHRPTFTLPHPTRHPRWFVFNAPQTSPQGYDDLRLPAKPGDQGSVKLLLLTAEKADGKYPSDWVPIRFRPDPRLGDFRVVKKTRTIGKGKNKGKTVQGEAYEFFDRHLKQYRPATISGIKLILRFNPDDSPRAAYMYLTCSVDNVSLTDRAKAIQWTETGEVTKKGKKRKSKKLPDGLVGCAVDLGLRHLGFATLARYADAQAQVLRSRSLWLGQEEAGGRHPGRWAEGADLAHIGRHKRKIRDLRRQRGKPVKGEQSHVELQEHIDHMAQDRFKQAARAIINFALNVERDQDRKSGNVHPPADVLLLERLGGLIPDAERERGINRALVNWNRGQLVKRVKEMAQDVGLKVFEVSPFATSQVCSRCGALGRRYSVVRDQQTARPEIRFGPVEKLFACPSPACGYRANADHNASVNLHRRFLLDDRAVASWTDKPRNQRDADIRKIEDALLPSLREMHGLTEPLPF